ncbi:MAG: hypothetical protein AAB342_03290 [Chloroflexota bacterium]
MCFSLLAAACLPTPLPPPTPTAPPPLNVSLWADYPVVVVGHEQGASVVVTDSSGAPVVGATVIGTYETPEGSERIMFVATGANGGTHVALRVPYVTKSETMWLAVAVVRGSDWGQAATSFELQP